MYIMYTIHNVGRSTRASTRAQTECTNVSPKQTLTNDDDGNSTKHNTKQTNDILMMFKLDYLKIISFYAIA